MSEFGEIFRQVWHEFQHITEIINAQVLEATNLVSQAESSSRFVESNTGLINQTRETIWRAYNNEKKLKKFYYKFQIIIRSIERSLVKASQNFSSCVSCTSSLQISLEDYTEQNIPRFLTRVKETGNHFKIQVNKLIWQEDETADSVCLSNSSKQPKIFFSNKIQSFSCKDVTVIHECLSKKGNCPKTLEHFQVVFEKTASVFANLKNLSRILLFVKLCMEKFGQALGDLKSLALNKLKFYQTLEKEAKMKVTNDKLYKIIARFIRIQNFLEEQVKKLESFVEMIPKQLVSCNSACIPIPIFQGTDQKDISSVILKVIQQVSLVMHFISSLLNQVVKKKAEAKVNPFIEERSFLFTVFHLRSIFLTKMQPYTLSINLKRYSHLLFNYLKEFSVPTIEKLISVKIINGKKHTRASISSSKHLVHSYNSSWDLQENFDNFESEFDETLEFHRYSQNNRKKTQKLSRTPDFSPIMTQEYNSMKSRQSVFIDVQSATLPAVQNAASEAKTTQGTDFDFMKKMKKLRNANAGFLSHRIQRIQNNRSISPLTKIEYIRDEFANEFKPTGLKLKNSLLKLKNKSTFLYTLK